MTETNPAATIQQITLGYALPRCLHAVAELGVADALGDSPRPAADLAADVGADADALTRMLRLLAANGVFELSGGMVSHNEASRRLRDDHPQSLRAFVRNAGSPLNWQIYGAIDHTARTGHPAVDAVIPEGLWAYRKEHPETGRRFNAAMEARARGQTGAVVAAFDFSPFSSVADIGGGRGHLLAAVLAAAPNAKGVLFDLPEVIADAAIVASDRVTLQGGSFFDDPLPVCDAYLLMEVIHDWAEDEAVAILKAIRRSAPPNARLLLVEQIIPDAPGPSAAIVLDVHMMVLNGGRQRSLAEYQALFTNAGFAFTRVIAAGPSLSIIEAIPAS
jgi:hypothetical protein